MFQVNTKKTLIFLGDFNTSGSLFVNTTNIQVGSCVNIFPSSNLTISTSVFKNSARVVVFQSGCVHGKFNSISFMDSPNSKCIKSDYFADGLALIFDYSCTSFHIGSQITQIVLVLALSHLF